MWALEEVTVLLDARLSDFKNFALVIAMGALGLFILPACARTSEPQSTSSKPLEDGIEYAFGGVDGQIVSSTSNRGRVTILLFVTTFDVASQLQARRLEDLVRTHVPRINAVAVVLEAPRNVELARTFRDVLDLHYPVVMVDRHSQDEHPILAKVKKVPSWLFLDQTGDLKFVAGGGLTPARLEEILRNVE